jgi:hypothetical protein
MAGGRRMGTLVYAVTRPDLAPFDMPDRFQHDITYFMTPSGEQGVPRLPHGEYWIRLDDSRRWLEDMVISVISPLDSAAKAEIELSEEQEAWLEWMVANRVEHVRLDKL